MSLSFDLSALTRPDLRDLQPYDPHPMPGMIKLDANENPFDFPEEVRSYLWKCFHSESFTRYPDPAAGDLRRELAAYTGVVPENIIAGNGSDELILYLMLAFGTGRRVLIATPTFSMYGIHARIAGARPVEVPRLPNFALDVDRLLEEAAHPAVSLLVICSPNNPTGNAALPGDIEALLAGTRALVVVDEAYIEFGGVSCVPLLKRYPNLVILRTLSKAFGLAGLRVGYLLADQPVIRELLKVKQPYNLNDFSQMAALAVLKCRESFFSLVEKILQNKMVLLEGMNEIPGVEVFPGVTNFLLFRTPLPADTVYRRLVDQGILIRNVSGPGLERCLRVTVGTPEENAIFLAKLKMVMEMAE